MCDMREPPIKVIIEDTIINNPYIGSFTRNMENLISCKEDKYPDKSGVYYVCYAGYCGCGYEYFNGKNWVNKCKMIFKPSENITYNCPECKKDFIIFEQKMRMSLGNRFCDECSKNIYLKPSFISLYKKG